MSNSHSTKSSKETNKFSDIRRAEKNPCENLVRKSVRKKSVRKFGAKIRAKKIRAKIGAKIRAKMIYVNMCVKNHDV
jgi:hypothetical protein